MQMYSVLERMSEQMQPALSLLASNILTISGRILNGDLLIPDFWSDLTLNQGQHFEENIYWCNLF